jgi:hypothetical protein
VKAPSLNSIRGSFSVNIDQLQILKKFGEWMSMAPREHSDDLKTAAEFPEEDKKQAELRALEEQNPFRRSIRQDIRDTVNMWSYLQGREEAAIFPQAIDPQLQIADALTSLHSAVSKLAKLATEKTGVRQFVLRYAYFLRRTCMYRPCSLMLDQVIKIASTDDCFPYTNGDFLMDSADNPRWERCKEAAKLGE